MSHLNERSRQTPPVDPTELGGLRHRRHSPAGLSQSMSSPNQRAEPGRAHGSAQTSPLLEPVAEHALSRIPPTGYGPFWPSLLGRGLLRWWMTAWPGRKSAKDW